MSYLVVKQIYDAAQPGILHYENICVYCEKRTGIRSLYVTVVYSRAKAQNSDDKNYTALIRRSCIHALRLRHPHVYFQSLFL